jgi:hypothetical protein
LIALSVGKSVLALGARYQVGFYAGETVTMEFLFETIARMRSVYGYL